MREQAGSAVVAAAPRVVPAAAHVVPAVAHAVSARGTAGVVAVVVAVAVVAATALPAAEILLTAQVAERPAAGPAAAEPAAAGPATAGTPTAAARHDRQRRQQDDARGRYPEDVPHTGIRSHPGPVLRGPSPSDPVSRVFGIARPLSRDLTVI